MPGRIGLLIHAESGPGVLHQITGVIARHAGDIVSVDILENRPPSTRVYLELDVLDRQQIRFDVGYRLPGMQAPATPDEVVTGETLGLPIAASFGIGESF